MRLVPRKRTEYLSRQAKARRFSYTQNREQAADKAVFSYPNSPVPGVNGHTAGGCDPRKKA
nr:MAG TPA: hypothetical protein [Caudoviricetes sp.]